MQYFYISDAKVQFFMEISFIIAKYAFAENKAATEN
jgi:hypothetical protein